MSDRDATLKVSNEAPNGTEHDLELDVTKLHSLPSEQQDLFLLTFVSDLLHHVESLESSVLPAHQPAIKKESIKILNLASPAPSRVIRNSLGQILGSIFRRGSRSLLYETINELLAVINSGKGEKDIRTKHAAVVCLGQVFGAAGDSALSLSGLTCASLSKLIKQAQSHAGLRASIYKAQSLVVSGLGSPVDEQVARDLWKQARNGSANDKAATVQKMACLCLQNLIISTSYFGNSNDFDSLKSTVWKVIESPFPVVRHAAASSLAAALVKAYSTITSMDTVPRIRKPKKSTKKQGPDEEEDEIERSGSPAPRSPAVQLTLSLQEIWAVLSSHYCRTSTNNRGRAGVAVCYKYVILQLPSKVIEENYGAVADHFFTGLLSHPAISYNRYRLLTARKYVSVLLEDLIGSTILSESAQINAARWLINDVLKNYPQVIKEKREPSKRALTSALSALSSLVSRLGSAAEIFGEACREALFQVIQHYSYTVQILTAHCFRVFVLACPQQLLPCVTRCITQLKQELVQLSEPRHSQRRSVGYANVLASILSTCGLQPLYGSLEVFSQVLSIATELLKASSSSELRVSATQVQVAWVLIGGLMPLGPNFVKMHLPQLLLLWRNALPRPLIRENIAKRATLEMSFLAHVRECALGAMLVFLDFNSSLITLDGSKRIANMLQNCVTFLDGLPIHRQSEEISNRLIPALQLPDLMIMVRRRVLQCFSKLVSLNHLENAEVLSQSNLLSLATSSFAEPENMMQRNLEQSIANSASNFENLWDLGDNWGFGVNGLVRGYEIELLGQRHNGKGPNSWAVALTDDPSIDDSLLSPICRAPEHDSILLYSLHSKAERAETDPPHTQVVNAAIELFAVALPLQPPRIQESSLEQIATLVAQPLQRDPGKKAALTVNTSTALLSALVVANRETNLTPGKIASSLTEKVMVEILRGSMVEADSYIRNIGVEAMGRLSSLSGSQFTNIQVNHLIETIVANRDPHIRAGCATALGSIHSRVGGMAAGFHLKTIVGVLLSLCSDPHPVVHFWALESLARVADSAGLTFSIHVTSTLGILAQLYTSDSHTDEAASFATSNLELEQPTPLVVSRCVDSLINVLGPDLQDVGKARNLILTMVGYFHREESISMRVEGLVCSGHLSMYVPKYLDLSDYVRKLQDGLIAPEKSMQDVCAGGLNNLMKRNAKGIIETAAPGLEEEIWLSLDKAPGHNGLQTIIRNWLQQTFLIDASDWVQQCQNVLSKTRVKAEVTSDATTAKSAAAPDLQDEEVAGFAAAAQGENNEKSAEGQEFLRWQTRSFAMACLSELLSLVGDAMLPDQSIPAELALQGRVADIVRMAFSASTANVVELRTWGLRILDQVLKLFGRTPDPDFVEASLLEQYQAQIGSALTPAFAADSSPELASAAISVCATFVATGIVTNVDRMGRIFKLLVTGLENITDTADDASIGDLKGLSSNARVMLKMATLSSWAQLQISSIEQQYLESIVQPYAAKLTPLWLSSLQEFAKLRFEPEISSSLGGPTVAGDLDEVYAALNRETRLVFYQDTWLSLVEAVAILVDKDSDFVFDALDGKLSTGEKDEVNGVDPKGKDISFREEPVAFFFILYGLAFEALVNQSHGNSAQTLAILQTLKKILRPAVSGSAVYQDIVFNETVDTLDRLALTEGSATQGVLVQISKNLALNHMAAKSGLDRNEKLSDDIEQLFELTRIMILILASILPPLENPPGNLTRPLTEDGVTLIRLSLEALVDAADIFPTVIRADLNACIFHIIGTILATGPCQAVVVPQAFPIFKRFLQEISVSPVGVHDVERLVRGCLSQFLRILARAQHRESEYALSCAKNTLLGITILLTSSGCKISPNDPLINKAIVELIDCLQDLGLAKVAASCIRSLLLVTPKTPCDEAVSRLLFPRLLIFVSDLTAEDPENTRTLIANALTLSVGTLPGAGRTAAYGMVIPALLVSAEAEGSEVYGETATRLLELASLDPAAFRLTAANMEMEERQLMEEVLRSRGKARAEVEEEDSDIDMKPTIELRMDF